MKDKITLSCKNKYAIVTGAAGEIGKIIAEVLAMAGCNIILLDLKENIDELINLSVKLQEEYAVFACHKTVDIRNGTEVQAFAEDLEKEFGPIDILVNNVGINLILPALQIKEEDWDNILDTNLKGTFLMCQNIGRLMVKCKSGVIVNIASQHGIVGNDNRAPYCASKGGIINLTRQLAIEWAKYQIRVNCVSPTYVFTEKNKNMLSEYDTSKKLLRNIPLGRYCTPLDVAQAVLFLVSPMAELITGHNLVVDGGYTAR